MTSWVLFALAALLLILAPFAPQLIRLRIRFFRWIHFNWAADWLEKDFKGWVVFARIIMIVVAIAFIYIGWIER